MRLVGVERGKTRGQVLDFLFLFIYLFIYFFFFLRYQALTIVILAVLVAVVASTSSDSLPPNSFSLFRDTTKRQRLVAQWLEDHPELRVWIFKIIYYFFLF